MPELQTKVIDNLTHVVSNTYSWNSGEKVNQTIKLGSADGTYTVSLTDVENIKYIMVSGTSPFVFTYTKDATTVSVDSESLVLFSPSEADRDLIESVTLTAMNTTATKYEINVFGEDV